MWINNNADIKRFEDTIKKCKESVWVVTDSGERYDLKDTREHYLGLASLLKSDFSNEPELFTASKADMVLLFRYLDQNEPMLKAC